LFTDYGGIYAFFTHPCNAQSFGNGLFEKRHPFVKGVFFANSTDVADFEVNFSWNKEALRGVEF
jgi:hypothetical protein